MSATSASYVNTGSRETREIAGERITFEWWQATDNLSPLPDAGLPRFPRRLDYEGREDGGWLQIEDNGKYGPCGCCFQSPCQPQCPSHTKPPRTPDYWALRWQRIAQQMHARAQQTNPLYHPAQSSG
jgi:hypothetical protein